MSLKIDNLRVDSEYFATSLERSERNEWIVDYYRALYYETQIVKFDNLSVAMKTCNKFWNLDFYEKQNVKDLLHTYHCNDKFCTHCKMVKQAVRMDRYLPEIKKHDNLYHIVFTQPNCCGKDLENTLQKMAKSFSYLTRYLKGLKRVKGVDYDSYGYEGAFRSLEITYSGDIFHPHYHAIFKFNNLVEDKRHINNFSYDYSSGTRLLKRLFSDFEILLQKTWRLLMDGERITKANLDALDIGYSVISDKVENEDTYYELFKYLTKTKDPNGQIITYEQFKVLYNATHSKKQIQGYGVFFNIKDEDEEMKKALTDHFYDEIIDELKKIESPQQSVESVKALSKDQKSIIIKRSKIKTYLAQLYHENLDAE